MNHLLEAGGSGAMVPWYNIRKDLFLDKVRWGAQEAVGGSWEGGWLTLQDFFLLETKGRGDSGLCVRDGVTVLPRRR